MGEICSIHGKMRNARNSLVGKLKGKRPPERPRCRFKDKLDLKEIECEGEDQSLQA
jgi:hypothetical protein